MSETRRLFFALWPNQAQQREWAKRASELLPPQGGRLLRPENLHITLLFAGHVTPTQSHCLEQLGESIRARPFTLHLDHLGHWRRPQVWWWGASEQPKPLLNLVQSLQVGAAQCGIELDRRPYQAHLTLARKVKRAPQADIDAVEWPVEDFVLVESVTANDGVSYQVQKRWPLIDSA